MSMILLMAFFFLRYVDFFFGMANIELKKSFLVKKREMLM
jgi:hypothetical protein